MDTPFFSIIIPTYNSEKTIEYTLRSIQEQAFEQGEIEILIVDGGSTDRTLDISRKYNATILSNPDRLPEHAKRVGVMAARGRYIIRMDSDEEFSYPTQLADKRAFYEKHKDVKVLISNMYIEGRKELCGISAHYMNILGDPFSYFVYRTKKDKCLTYARNIIQSDGNEMIMKFGPDDLYPLADSGTCSYSLEFIKEAYPQEFDTIEFTCGTFDKIIGDTGVCGCIKGDNIHHNCSSQLKTYLKKLKFRVVNNVFHKGESGFSSHVNKIAVKRTILFVIYTLFVPLPILDSIRLAIKYHDLSFLLHALYLYYVCLCIFCSYCNLVLGRVQSNKSYG